MVLIAGFVSRPSLVPGNKASPPESTRPKAGGGKRARPESDNLSRVGARSDSLLGRPVEQESFGMGNNTCH